MICDPGQNVTLLPLKQCSDMTSRANPQGKGLVPVLDAWRSAQPAIVEAKSAERLLTDYFTALLVLSAEFSFKPRQGVPYYLYLAGGEWRLSLVSPTEWGERGAGTFAAACQLRADMTWELQLREDVASEPGLVEALQHFHENFVAMLESPDTLEQGLPFYVNNLHYYRRLFASGLASSLAQSMSLAGLTGKSSQQWLKGLPQGPLKLVGSVG